MAKTFAEAWLLAVTGKVFHHTIDDPEGAVLIGPSGEIIPKEACGQLQLGAGLDLGDEALNNQKVE